MAFVVNREELAWAAGLFEGEGCFSAQKNSSGRYTSRAQITMSDLDILERFARTVGVGKVHPRKQNNPSHKKLWHWRVTSYEEVQHILSILWNHLGPRRRARGAEVLRLNTSRGNGVRLYRIDIPEILRLLSEGMSQELIAEKYFTDQTVISDIKRGLHRLQRVSA